MTPTVFAAINNSSVAFLSYHPELFSSLQIQPSLMKFTHWSQLLLLSGQKTKNKCLSPSECTGAIETRLNWVPMSMHIQFPLQFNAFNVRLVVTGSCVTLFKGQIPYGELIISFERSKISFRELKISFERSKIPFGERIVSFGRAKIPFR